MKTGLFVFACVAGSCFGQQPSFDQAFLGPWNLELSKSKFPPGVQAPKSAQVVVNHNGYVMTQQGGTAAPPSLAVAIVRGECYLIGPFDPSMSCAISSENPRRHSLSIKVGDHVLRKSDIELVGEGTLTVKTTIQGSPGGAPVIEEAVFTKAQAPPSPTKK